MEQAQTPAGYIIDQIFGGSRHLSRLLTLHFPELDGVAQSTVHSWKRNGFIPGDWPKYLMSLADHLRLPLEASHFIDPTGEGLPPIKINGIWQMEDAA